MKKIWSLPTIACLLALYSISDQQAQADVSIVAQQANGGVVFSYNGTLRASELAGTSTYQFNTTPRGRVWPTLPEIDFAPDGGAILDGMRELGGVVASSPSSFGPGSTRYPTIFGGDYFSIGSFSIGVPNGYTDGATISGTMTFSGETFTSMGMTATNGVPYSWVLDNGETVTLLIDNSVPSPVVTKSDLEKRIKKLKSKLKSAKRQKKKKKAKKIKKQLRDLKRELRAR